ncbi:MAG: aldehyde dehydrogenase (NADP(+)), partial [Verrucomicrobiota bacterium]
FCTNPGLVFMPADRGDAFLTKLKSLVEAGTPGMMLNSTICKSYADAKAFVAATDGVGTLACCASEAGPGQGSPAVFTISIKDFLLHQALQHEMFGPATLIVRGSLQEIEAAIQNLEGQLTASLHATDAELAQSTGLVNALQQRAGRLIFNGFPTGVEVCNSMVHGGPFPATSDGRSTSVGTMAIYRFCRPVAWQSFPDAALPPELQEANPLGIRRME